MANSKTSHNIKFSFHLVASKVRKSKCRKKNKGEIKERLKREWKSILKEAEEG
jgi:hypothetical protein